MTELKMGIPAQRSIVCIGNHFAMMELVMVLAMIVRKYRLELLQEAQPEALITLRPKDGIRMRVHKR